MAKNANSLFFRTMAGHEARTVLWMLQAANWNRKEAALRLGISYRTILYKIEKYELSPES